jgi:outer membrane receptor protein involved in Fe transport
MKKPTQLFLSAVLLMGTLVASNAVMFRANVYNLLDKEYIGQGDAYGYFYGNGTTWNASLQYRF